MNDGKKRRSSAELPAYKRFEKSRSRWTVSYTHLVPLNSQTEIQYHRTFYGTEEHQSQL